MARHRAKRRRERGSLGISIAIFAAVALAFGLGGWQLYKAKAQRELLDEQTYCPKSGPVGRTVVLIDRTDRLSDLQAEALRRRITIWANAVPKYGAFSVYEVGESGAKVRPTVSVCNPGDGSDISEFDGNPRLARERYEDKYKRQVDRLLVDMLGEKEAATSPILEGIQAIAVREFGPDAGSAEKQLIIVSDLLQYSGTLDLYRGIPQRGEFETSAAGRSVLTSLAEVRVEFQLIQRSSAAKFQSDELGAFWINLLEGQGATIERFERLPG